MVGTVTFILGLCGSGKSELIRQLDADRKFDEGFAWNRHGEHEDLVAALQSGGHCAVIEVAYCVPGPREEFLEKITRAVPGLRVRWICFENDLAQANRNCVDRNDGRDLKMLFAQNQFLSPAYTYPPGAEIRPVWRPEPIAGTQSTP